MHDRSPRTIFGCRLGPPWSARAHASVKRLFRRYKLVMDDSIRTVEAEGEMQEKDLLIYILIKGKNYHIKGKKYISSRP